MNREKAKILHNALIASMQPIIDEFRETHAVDLRVGMRASFDETTFSLKLEASDIDESGIVRTPEYEALLVHLPELGITEDDLKTPFKHPTRGEFKLVGWRTRAPKRPLVIEINGGPATAGEGFLRAALAA